MIQKDQNTRNHSAWTFYRERGSHARAIGVYLTQYTSRMGAVRVKQEVETDIIIMQ